MIEEFFERLREKGELPKRDPPYSPLEKFAFFRGRAAIIEALKEMMVGEPIGVMIKQDTFILMKFFDGHYGTDGEEAIVLVVRLS